MFRTHRDLGLTFLAFEPWYFGDDGGEALAAALLHAEHVAQLTLFGKHDELKSLLPRLIRKRPDLKVEATVRP
jgi:hypothetical protein